MIRYFATIILLATLYSSNCVANDLTQNYTIAEDETLYDIARRFDLGVDELMLANPDVDPWIPRVGSTIILPTTHLLPDAAPKGIIINIAEPRLYYFSKNGDIKTFPIGIGMEFSQTPLGITKIATKRKNPTWIPPESIRMENPDLPTIVPPGDDNPLGQYAMNLESNTSFKWSRISIHGTNRPWSIGAPSSHGCIRLYPEDIEALFNDVDLGTMVAIVNQPIKVRMINNELYIEVHPTNAAYTNLPHLLSKHMKDEDIPFLNWDAIGSVLKESNGIPTNISY